MAEQSRAKAKRTSVAEMGIAPRAEAELKGWEVLTEAQTEAAIGIHKLFSQMADESWCSEENTKQPEFYRFLPKIDTYRKSRVALVEGARGTGKTVVLLRLIQDWSAQVRGKKAKGSPLKKPKAPIVPIGVVDLEALPPSANLPIYLAGQFQRIVEAIELRHQKRTDVKPWAPCESEELKSRQAWQKFFKSAAATWDGLLQHRQGSIDPETHALELEQAERQRLHVVPCFRAFIDALVKDYQEWQRGDAAPLFVIAIDDADMNPDRVRDVFELLRTLWHPRVAYLVAGNIDLFSLILRQYYQTHLALPNERILPERVGGGALSDSDQRIASLLAEDVFRKAIPPAQRFSLKALLLQERLELLKSTLSSISIKARSIGKSLLDYFALDSQTQNALPTRLREIEDLKQLFQLQAAESREDERAARFAMRLWENSLRDAEVFRLDLDNYWNLVSLKENTNRLVVIPKYISWRAESKELGRVAVGERSNVIWEQIVRFDAISSLPSEPVRSLPAHMAGALALAMDLAAFEKLQPPSSQEKPRWEEEPTVVHVEHILNDGTRVRLPWILPAWNSFVEYDLFARAWCSYLEREKATAELSIEEGALLFLRLVLAVFDGERDPERMAHRVVLDWNGLARAIVSPLKENDGGLGVQFVPRVLWVLNIAPLLAAPEYGLPMEAAEKWLSELEGELGGQIVNGHFFSRDSRLRQARRVFEGDRRAEEKANEFLKWIDHKNSKHPWLKRHNEKSTLQAAFARAVQSLKEITVRGLYWKGESSAAQLYSYLTNERRQMLGRTNPDIIIRFAEDLTEAGKVRGAEWFVLSRALNYEQHSLDWIRVEHAARNVRIVNDAPRVCTQLVGQSGTSVALGKNRLLSRVVQNVTLDRSLFLENGASEFQEALIRIMCDLHVDSLVDRSDLQSVFALGRLWLGAEVALDSGYTIRWPSPDWPTFIDGELLVESWNGAISALDKLSEQLLSVEDDGVAGRLVDALAYVYLDSISGIARSREIGKALQLDLTSEHWQELGLRLLNAVPTPTQNPRALATLEWWKYNMILMAAPESGLTAEAANAFLSAICPVGEKGGFSRLQESWGRSSLKEFPVDDDNDRMKLGMAGVLFAQKDIPRARMERFMAAGASDSEARETLLRIDDKYPEYNFVRYFGEGESRSSRQSGD